MREEMQSRLDTSKANAARRDATPSMSAAKAAAAALRDEKHDEQKEEAATRASAEDLVQAGGDPVA